MSERRPLVRRTGPRPVAETVTTVELFFDLVFVFAITQLTSALRHDPSWRGLGHVVLMLAIMWWMYGGYAWLTNAVPPVSTGPRLFLLVGMIGNFAMALAVPHAYGPDALLFALGYAVVVLVHASMYLTHTALITWGMVWQLVVGNGLAAVLVVVGALLGGAGLTACWLLALAAAIVLPRMVGSRTVRAEGNADLSGFEIQPAHFVERHGLMLIIVLGESVLAIGVGVGSADAVGSAQVAFAAISLMLAASFYWAYFGTGEDHAAERVLARGDQPASALNAFGYAFFLILLGVVLLAAGLHHALIHPTHPLDLRWSLQLGGGAGIVWLGLACFRMAVRRRDVWARLAGVGLCAVAAWLTTFSAVVGLVGLLLASFAVLGVERAHTERRS